METLEGRRLLAGQPTAQLIDAATDSPIGPMSDGMTIDMGVVGTELNINAFPDGPAGSIRFLIDGQVIKTESYAPYTIGGDSGGDFHSWTPPVGDHTLQMQQFSGSSASGSLLGTTTMSISVVSPDSQEPTSPPPASPVSPPPASPPPAAGGLRFNFQPGSAPAVSGYVVDGGQTYGSRNGHAYGWSTDHTDAVVDRNVRGDQVLDTNVGVKARAKWDVAIPNGRYDVTVGVGDAAASSKNNVWIEGSNNIFQYVTLGSNQFQAKTTSVNISDGKLTFGVGGASTGQTRINYISVAGAGIDDGTSPPVSPPPASPPPPTSPPPPSAGMTLNLINAVSDLKIATLADGATIDLASVGSSVSIAAVPDRSVASVVFTVNGSYRHVEGAQPYAIAGDSGGDYFAWEVSPGQYTISAAGYSQAAGQGEVVSSAEVTVTVVDSGGNPPLSPPPASPPPPVSPPPPPISGNVPTPSDAPLNSGTPTAVLKVVGSTTGVAGMPVVVNATNSSLPNSPLYASYQWDFGDPNGAYNQLPGWTAGHIYDKPGVYTVRLTVTDANGKASTATTTINVTSDNRKTVYVDAVNGNDGNNGSLGAPIRSYSKATQFATNNVKILFKRGQSWNTNYWLSVTGDNVHIGAYGAGANPVLKVVSNKTAIQTFGGSDRTLIENITFDSPYAPSGNLANKVGVNGIFAGGTNVAIRGCTFLNLDDGVNANQQPNGLIFQDNDAPSATGIRGYMLWTEGNDIVALGNSSANSTREHNMRIKDGNRLLIAYNNFTNLSRESIDKQDIKKGTIEMQRGSWAYIYGNTVKDGPMRVGPRGEATEPSTTRTNWVVVDNNKISNYQLNVYPGTQHLMIRNNTFNNNAQSGIGINPTDPQGRPLTDVHIIGNTAYNSATTGRFLRVEGGLATGTITLGNNKYIAPNMMVGSDNTVGVSVAANNLSGFKSIYNNIWPLPQDSIRWAEGGIMWVYPNYSGQIGYKDPQEWASYSQVKGDVFKNI